MIGYEIQQPEFEPPLIGRICFRLDGFPQGDNIGNLPKPIGNSSGHRGRHAKRLTNVSKIVIHHMKCYCIGVVFDRL